MTSDTTNGATDTNGMDTTPPPPPEVSKAAKEAPKVEVTPSKEAPKIEATKAEAPKTPLKAEAPKAPQPRAGLRLRMKVWTDPAGKRYLMPSAVITDPVRGIMTAYAMSDEDTRPVKLTPVEWNALPFFYFQEDGPAPRASARPVDVIR